MIRFAPCFLALGILVLAGCSRSHPSAAVSGRITLNGKPLANAGVSFQPVSDGSPYTGPGSFGFTDAEGRYDLKQRTMDEAPGAVIGKHVVAIDVVAAPREDDAPRPKLKRLPARYNDKSTLEFEVPSSGTSEADFDLQPK